MLKRSPINLAAPTYIGPSAPDLNTLMQQVTSDEICAWMHYHSQWHEFGKHNSRFVYIGLRDVYNGPWVSDLSAALGNPVYQNEARQAIAQQRYQAILTWYNQAQQLQKTNQDNLNQFINLVNQRESEGDDECNSLQIRIEQLEAELDKLKVVLKEEVSKAELEKKQALIDIERKQKDVNKLEAEVENLKAKVVRLELELINKDNIIRSASEKIKKLETENKQQEDYIKRLVNNIEEWKTYHASSEASYKKILEQLEASYKEGLMQSGASYMEKLKELETDLSNGRDENNLLKLDREKQLNIYNAKLVQMNEQHQEDINNLNKQHQEEINNLNKKLAKAEIEFAKSKSDLRVEKERDDRELTALKQEKEKVTQEKDKLLQEKDQLVSEVEVLNTKIAQLAPFTNDGPISPEAKILRTAAQISMHPADNIPDDHNTKIDDDFDPVKDKNLISYWPLHGDQLDNKMNNNTGRQYGVEIKFEGENHQKLMHFDGTSYVYGTANRFPKGSKAISLWFMGDEGKNGVEGGALFSHSGGDSSNLAITFNGMTGNQKDEQNICAYTWGKTENGIKYNLKSVDELKGWKHLVVSSEYGSGTDLYLDGKHVAHNDFLFGPSKQEEIKSYAIGALTYENNPIATPNCPGFKGVIQDVMIYNRGLSQEEVNNLFNEQSKSHKNSNIAQSSATLFGKPVVTQDSANTSSQEKDAEKRMLFS